MLRASAAIVLGAVLLTACGDERLPVVHDAGDGNVGDATGDAPVVLVAPIITGTVPVTSQGAPSRNRLPVITGIAPHNAAVDIFAGACGAAVLATGSADASGAFSIAIANELAADGVTSIFARATVNSTNSPCSPMAFDYFTDNTPPAAPQITASTPMTTATMPTKLRTPSVAGTAEPGATIVLSLQPDCSTPIANGTADGSGTFSIMLTMAVAVDGATALYAAATDAAGNTSACSSAFTYYTDNTAPAAPAITSSTPASSASMPTKALQPMLTGTAEAGTTVSIHGDTACSTAPLASALTSSGGTFATTLTSPVAADGMSALYARATDYAGNSTCATSAFVYYTDNTAPTVTLVTSPNANGYYNAPDVITVDVVFSEAVIVTGAPRLVLYLGGVTGYASYAGGSTTNTLAFTYTVGSSDRAWDLDYASTTALQLNGGSIGDAATNPAVLTLPPPGSAGSLGAAKDIYIDTYAPTVQNFQITPTVIDATPPANVGLSFSWYASDDQTPSYDLDYQLCRGTTPTACTTSFTVSATIPRGASSYVDTNLPQNQRYWYVLRVIDRAGNFRDFTATWYDDMNHATTAGVYAKSPADRATVEIVAGRAHTCALTGQGSVYCWGDNTYGQLGLGYIGNSPGVSIPTRVGVYGAMQLVAGDNHTCALTEFGVSCWGDNQYGQLGVGDFMPRASPTGVGSASVSYRTIVAAANHTCALTGGTPYCWGRNQAGQLGDGSITNRPTPVAVVGGPAGNLVVEIAGGDDFTCILQSDGAIACIGDNSLGQLGSNGVTPLPGSAVNVELPAGQPAIAIGGGGQHACALLADRSIWCWGRGLSGELGDGGSSNQPVPTRAGTALFASLPHHQGFATTCALGIDRRPYCWGSNAAGNVGAGSDPQTTPISPTSLNMIAVAAGGEHTCGVGVDGRVQCWGANAAGQRGDAGAQAGAAIAPSFGPYDVAVPKQIAVGYFHACALETDGNALCWGENSSGQLSNLSVATRTNYPVGVTGADGTLSQIAANGSSTCAIGSDGRVLCWGLNNHGQLGNNSLQSAATMTGVLVDATTPLTGVTALTVGADLGCALAAGQPYCWGSNASLVQGGLDSAADQLVAAPVGARDGQAASYGSALRIAAGGQHVCLVHGQSSRFGKLSCWGDSSAYQLGIAATSDVPYPSTTSFVLSDVRDLSCGRLHSCAISGVTASCWGSDASGQLGNGTGLVADQSTPQTKMGSYRAIRAGYDVSCSFDTYTSCWGENSFGELGVGTRNDEPTGTGYSIPPRLRDAQPGGRHTCFLTTDGAVQCSGFNGADTTSAPGSGELGTGDWSDRLVKTYVRWL